MLVRSHKLSARHGYSTREGGVSTGRYASLNLSYKWGDARENVDENRRRFAAAGDFSLERLYTAKQVHGTDILTIDEGSDREHLASQAADGLVTDVPGVAIAIGTADCVPVLLSDGCGRVAALHAGWRGTVGDIVGRGVDALVALGSERASLVAALGPCICVGCFEVGEEVAAPFEVLGAVVRGQGKPHVDLRLANRVLLERAGVHEIDDAPPCTMCERDRYFSFRRDGGEIGQQLSFVMSS
ncbi:MAG: peptidoglycan editing factor PgeF [Polyangia bacterium]